MIRPSRRSFLRGAGVALTLPWLETLAPRAASAQAAGAIRRYVMLYFPNGSADFWRPQVAGSGDAWRLSPILEPLGPVKNYVTVLTNVSNYAPFGGHVEAEVRERLERRRIGGQGREGGNAPGLDAWQRNPQPGVVEGHLAVGYDADRPDLARIIGRGFVADGVGVQA